MRKVLPRADSNSPLVFPTAMEPAKCLVQDTNYSANRFARHGQYQETEKR